MSNELSIILPTLNEGKNLEKLIPQISEILLNKNIESSEILVMDDGSTDGTEEMCQSLNNRYGNIRFIRRNNEPSLPLAIYEGIESAKFQNVAWMDADGSMPADTLGILVDDFFKNMDNIVIGSRFVKGGGYKGVKNLNSSLFEAAKNVRNSNDSVFGMIFSMYFNKFLVFLFNSEVKDLTSGFIVGKKTLFQKKIFERSNYGDYFVYLVADLIKSNINIKEIGYICETRMYGESKTASSIFQLFRRGIPYIKAAYNCRREF